MIIFQSRKYIIIVSRQNCFKSSKKTPTFLIALLPAAWQQSYNLVNVFNFRIQVFVSVSEWLQPSPGLETPAPAISIRQARAGNRLEMEPARALVLVLVMVLVYCNVMAFPDQPHQIMLLRSPRLWSTADRGVSLLRLASTLTIHDKTVK